MTSPPCWDNVLSFWFRFRLISWRAWWHMTLSSFGKRWPGEFFRAELRATIMPSQIRSIRSTLMTLMNIVHTKPGAVTWNLTDLTGFWRFRRTSARHPWVWDLNLTSSLCLSRSFGWPLQSETRKFDQFKEQFRTPITGTVGWQQFQGFFKWDSHYGAYMNKFRRPFLRL